ncbi:outer membrane protein assembly factor BamA [Halosquirtibacter laminarini]|uniref:Outer membrane protein assembly factor BamA n=1 Tax=Halosquirtibacter laminarini TaxID=3374600 RepID=A0AC61NPC3_9BACT|nr:outer membrane protein assembly factor BamA [Prolixibacteraceae bacterium]
MQKKLLVFVIAFMGCLSTFAQLADSTNFSIYYDTPKEYEIGGIQISGIKYLDTETLLQLSGLEVGETVMVPGEKVTAAIKKYWKQGLFSDVKITATKIVKGKIYLDIFLQERPRLSTVNFTGVSKGEREDIEEKVLLLKGSQVTDNSVNTAKRIIQSMMREKGFLNTEVTIVQRDDPEMKNYLILDINVDKKEKVKIQNIYFEGNKALETGVLERAMKKTKAKKLKNFFSTKKFLEDKYKEDKVHLIEKYNEKGYRDAVIVSDTVVPNLEHSNRVDIKIKIQEGKKYFFRDIRWIGNTVYTSEQLSNVLGIKAGDVFDQKLLEDRLRVDDDAIANQYMNNGYLFFNVSPVEVNVQSDSIDFEMRVFEGRQATISKVIIKGNDKTNEHVARREIRTRPGMLFSREDIIRSVRELAQLQHFNPEKIVPTPVPHPEEGTVDIEYSLEEQSNSKVELSGGWGAGMFVGSLGLTFNNFSLRRLFSNDGWGGSILPSGDGQTLSVRAQTNGSYYQNYNFSFVEPWLGGKKPNSFSFNIYYSKQTSGDSNYSYYSNPYGSYGGGYNSGYGGYNGSQYDYEITKSMQVFGTSIGLGHRLKWPDDYFTLYHEISYQRYVLNNWPYFLMADGVSNNLSFKNILSRNSVDNPLYPRRGSNFKLLLELTLPYSVFSDKDWSDKDMKDSEKYKWIEYYKTEFSGDIYTTLSKNNKLVLRTKFEYGFLGYYNEDLRSPFGTYQVGGDGMSGYNYYGSSVIGLRGYANNSLTPYNPEGNRSAYIYNKYLMELRYPLTLSQSATIYGLAFVEAGNSWYDSSTYDPFNLKRSAGAGIRIFLPMIGQIGFDWGYGFDTANTGRASDSGSQFHFVFGQSF